MPKSDFQSHFSMSKSFESFWIFYFSLEEGFMLLSFFENFNFWTTLFSKMVPNFRRSMWRLHIMWTTVKVKSKNCFYFTDFFPKIYSLLTHVRKTPITSIISPQQHLPKDMQHNVLLIFDEINNLRKFKDLRNRWQDANYVNRRLRKRWLNVAARVAS